MSTTIDPMNRVAEIIDADPILAEAVFDVIVFVMNCEDPPHNSQVDRMLEMAYARTEEATEQRLKAKDRRRSLFFADEIHSTTLQPPIEV